MSQDKAADGLGSVSSGDNDERQSLIDISQHKTSEFSIKNILRALYATFVAYCVGRISIPLAIEFVHHILKYRSDKLVGLLIPTSAAPAFTLSILSNYMSIRQFSTNLINSPSQSAKKYWFALTITLLSALPSIKIADDFIENQTEAIIVAIGLFFSALGTNGRFATDYWQPVGPATKERHQLKNKLKHLSTHDPEEYMGLLIDTHKIFDVRDGNRLLDSFNVDPKLNFTIPRQSNCKRYGFLLMAGIAALNNLATGFSSSALFGEEQTHGFAYFIIGIIIGVSSALVNAAIHIFAFNSLDQQIQKVRNHQFTASEKKQAALPLLLVFYFSIGFALRSGGFAWAYPFPSESFLENINLSQKHAKPIALVFGIIESIFTFCCSFALSVMAITQFFEGLSAFYMRNKSSFDGSDLHGVYDSGNFFTKQICLQVTTTQCERLLFQVNHL